MADLHLHKLDEPLVIAWRRLLAIEVIDDLGQVAGQPLAFGFGHAAPPQQGSAFPDTGQNTLMLPMYALSAPRQRKPLESHDLDTTARVHHAARRRGGRAGRSRYVRSSSDAGAIQFLDSKSPSNSRQIVAAHTGRKLHRTPFVMEVHPSVPTKTVPELHRLCQRQSWQKLRPVAFTLSPR